MKPLSNDPLQEVNENIYNFIFFFSKKNEPSTN